jgi:hypothetical protein
MRQLLDNIQKDDIDGKQGEGQQIHMIAELRPRAIEKLSVGRQAIRRELFEMVMDSFESKES